MDDEDREWFAKRARHWAYTIVLLPMTYCLDPGGSEELERTLVPLELPIPFALQAGACSLPIARLRRRGR